MLRSRSAVGGSAGPWGKITCQSLGKVRSMKAKELASGEGVTDLAFFEHDNLVGGEWGVRKDAFGDGSRKATKFQRDGK